MLRICSLSLALVALSAHGEARTVRLDVQKMFCAACPFTVRLALRKTPGVLDASVTLEPPVATVTYDDAKTGPQQVMRATENAGFPSSVRKRP